MNYLVNSHYTFNKIQDIIVLQRAGFSLRACEENKAEVMGIVFSYLGILDKNSKCFKEDSEIIARYIDINDDGNGLDLKYDAQKECKPTIIDHFIKQAEEYFQHNLLLGYSYDPSSPVVERRYQADQVLKTVFNHG